MNLIVQYFYPLLLFSMRWLWCVTPSPSLDSMFFYSHPVPVFGLCWKILFLSANLRACHNTYNLYSHISEGGWSPVNKQLFGILGIQGRFYLSGRTCWQLYCLCIYVTFSFVNVACWELTCFIRETRQKGKRHRCGYLKKINVYYDSIRFRI